MNLKTFADNINSLLKKYPAAAEFQVIASSDDEGNSFNPIHYTPYVCNFTDDEIDEEGPSNAVCVN
jgi:hypothetical protein